MILVIWTECEHYNQMTFEIEWWNLSMKLVLRRDSNPQFKPLCWQSLTTFWFKSWSFQNYCIRSIFQSHEHFKILASFLGTAKWKTRGRLSSELWCTWWRKDTPTSSSPNLSTSRQIKKLSSQRYNQVSIISCTVKMHKDLSFNEVYIFKSFVKWKKSFCEKLA